MKDILFDQMAGLLVVALILSWPNQKVIGAYFGFALVNVLIFAVRRRNKK